MSSVPKISSSELSAATSQFSGFICSHCGSSVHGFSLQVLVSTDCMLSFSLLHLMLFLLLDTLIKRAISSEVAHSLSPSF